MAFHICGERAVILPKLLFFLTISNQAPIGVTCTKARTRQLARKGRSPGSIAFGF